MSFKEKLKRWWDGQYIPPENDPNAGFYFTMGTYKLSWTSKAAHVLADFWLKYWQWTIGVMIALLALWKK